MEREEGKAEDHVGDFDIFQDKKKKCKGEPEVQDRCGSGHLRTNYDSVQGILVCETSSSPGVQVSKKPAFVESNKESWI